MAARKSSAVSGTAMNRSPFIWAEMPVGHRERSHIKKPRGDVDRYLITTLA
jgi:hypothetical protein